MTDNNNKIKGKLLEFLDNKGFYIVLLICVGIITLTAFVVTKRNIASYMESDTFDELINEYDNTPILDERLVLNDIPKENELNLDEKSYVENEDTRIEQSKESNSIVENTIKKNHSDNITKESQKAEEKNVEVPAVAPVKPKKNYSFELPVQGKIVREFAKNNLIYSKTLEQWTTHEGIDISADRGVPVKAAYDGIVTNIYNDARFGITIVIQHDDYLQTKYSNLSTDEMVEKGLKIKKGDVISGVGNTALFESGEQPHVHFEVLENNACVNPDKYIK